VNIFYNAVNWRRLNMWKKVVMGFALLAVSNGAAFATERLIPECLQPSPVEDVDWQNPAWNSSAKLTWAVAGGHSDIVKKVLEGQADPDPSLEYGIRSEYISNVEILKLLLEHGANPNRVDPDNGWTPLHFVSLNSCHRLELVRILIQYKVKLDAQTYPRKLTPLMLFADIGALSEAQALVDGGASINLRNEFGDTALTLAIRGHHDEVAKYLRSKGGIQ